MLSQFCSLSAINSTSKRSGIQVVRYNFSDPQAGEDLCDRRIAPCNKRLINYEVETNDIQTAQNLIPNSTINA